MPHARALLLLADGEAIGEVALLVKLNRSSVRQWQRQFEKEGVGGGDESAPEWDNASWLPEGTAWP